jgi:hypothetical protein
MPSKIKRYDSDPDRKGRGAGNYYLRSKSDINNTQRIYAHHSKYNPLRDEIIIARNYEDDHIAQPRKDAYRHTFDGFVQDSWQGSKKGKYKRGK